MLVLTAENWRTVAFTFFGRESTRRARQKSAARWRSTGRAIEALAFAPESLNADFTNRLSLPY